MSEAWQALDDLLHSPGWHLFEQMARKEWGADGYGRKVKLAIAEAKEHRRDIVSAVDAVDYDAAGKLEIGLWDHWVPGANDAMNALCKEWADREKVETLPAEIGGD